MKTYTINTATHKVVAIEPEWRILNAMAGSRAKDDEGEFDALVDLINFSGENKTRLALKFAYKSAIAAAPEYPADAGWISVDERLPIVKHGDEEEFNIHARIKSNGRIIVRSAHFLNNLEIENLDDDEKRFFSGWHSDAYHDEYSGYYEPLDHLEVISWMPLPSAPIFTTNN